MDNTSDGKGIFTCPHCSGKFKASIETRPKAYKCPNCKNTVTILGNGVVKTGDHAREAGDHAIDGSMEMLNNISSRLIEEGKKDDSFTDGEEKRLFSEIMERMKDISSKQERAVIDRPGQELQTLKEENSLLKARISTLTDELAKARSFTPKGYTNATERDIEKKDKGFDERKLALDRREKELEELNEHITKEKDALEEFRKELYLYQGKLENKAVSLSNEEDEIERIKNEYAHVQDLAEDLKTRESELDERECSLNEMENDMNITMMNQKQTENLIGAIQERENALSLMEKDLKERESALRSSFVKWKDFAKKLANYRKSLAGTSEELMRRERNLLYQERKLESARNKLKELKMMISQETEVLRDPSLKGDNEDAPVRKRKKKGRNE